MKTGIDVHINGYENAIISEDEKYYYIDLRTGMGEALYCKDDFTLDEAINEEINFKFE